MLHEAIDISMTQHKIGAFIANVTEHKSLLTSNDNSTLQENHVESTSVLYRMIIKCIQHANGKGRIEIKH